MVEENKDDELNLSGRMSDNTIVHFSGGSRLAGEIVNVKLIEACGFYLKADWYKEGKYGFNTYDAAIYGS